MPRTMIFLSTKSETLHQIYWIDHEGAAWSESQLSSLKDKVIDSIDQTITINDDFIEAMLNVGLPLDLITMRPGVTDNAANSFKELIQLDPVFREQKLEVHSGLLRNKGKLDFNPLIQSKRTITDLHQLKQVSQLDFSLKLVTAVSYTHL